MLVDYQADVSVEFCGLWEKTRTNLGSIEMKSCFPYSITSYLANQSTKSQQLLFSEREL